MKSLDCVQCGQALKLLAEAMFVYLFIFCNSQSFAHVKLKNISLFVSIYVGMCSVCSVFIGGFTCKFVGVFCVILWAIFNRTEKYIEWKYLFSFGVVSVLFVEFCYLVSYKLVELVDRIFKVFDVNLSIVFTSCVVLVLYTVILGVFCSLKVINKRDIRNISSQKYSLVLFTASMIMVSYIKEQLVYISKYSYLYDILWYVVLMIIPVYTVFYVILSNVIRLKNTDYNYDIDGVIESGLEVPRCCAMFNIEPCSRTYESEKVIFRKKLNSLHIDHGFKGYSQLILCLVMIRHFEHKSSMDLKQDIFKCVSDFTKTNIDALYASFAKMIDNTWLNETTESLQYGYMTDDENIKLHVPTVEEFVLHLAQATV